MNSYKKLFLNKTDTFESPKETFLKYQKVIMFTRVVKWKKIYPKLLLR